MSSIANRKYTDMRQIEFQQSGSGQVSAMLVQPLLEKSSTYMCEITDLQCSVGEELAFPENQWLLSVFKRPVHANHRAHLNLSLLQKYSDNKTLHGRDSMPQEFYGYYGINGWQAGYMLNTDTNAVEEMTEEMRGESVVYSRRYYSVMDFVNDVAMQIKRIDKMIRLSISSQLDDDDPNKKLDWTEFAENTFDHISMTYDSGGRIEFNVSNFFVKNYMIVTSPLFQKVTGYDFFIHEYSTTLSASYISTLDDFEIANFLSLDFGLPEFDIYNVSAAPVGDDENIRTTEVRDKIPIQTGIDIRKKIIVEVSLPISHTLSWDGEKESTRYVLQEFEFPSEQIDLGYETRENFRQSIVRFKEKGVYGTVAFLNGGSNLAIKKLQEGQMQAFRVSLVLDYNKWDAVEREFKRVQRPLNIGNGGFFYLKLLFTKETI